MATFYAIKRSDFPAGWEDTPYSTEAFLREIKPYAVAVQFDGAANDREIYRDNWADGEYPEAFRNWAEEQGDSPDNYLFIVSGDPASDRPQTFPPANDFAWAAWPSLEDFSVNIGTLEWRIEEGTRMANNARTVLATVIR